MVFHLGTALALRSQGRPPGLTLILTSELVGNYAVSSRSVGLFHMKRRGGRALVGLSLPYMT